MAPALTQETQPELLLPYLSTPPYTPSPPTALLTPALAAGGSNGSGSNMEQAPSGANHHHPENNIDSVHANSTLHHHHSIEVTKLKHKLDPSTAVLSSASSSPQLLSVIDQPTPPHSADSSAPLSPLEKASSSAILKNCSQEDHKKDLSEVQFSPHNNINKTSTGNNLAPIPHHLNSDTATSNGGSIITPTMGCCSLNDSELRGRMPVDHCSSAPQPNDTPPPPLLPSPAISQTQSPVMMKHYSTNTAASSSVNHNTIPSDIFNEGDILPSIADEIMSYVSMDPSLMEQFNATVSANSVTPNVSATTCIPSTSHGMPTVMTQTPDQQVDSLRSFVMVRQLRLQKRRDQLLRRVRRITGRALGSTVSSQLRLLIEESSRPPINDSVPLASRQTTKNNSHALESSDFDKASHLDPAALKSMCPSSLVSYVRQIEGIVRAKNASELLVLPEPVQKELRTVVQEVRGAAQLHNHHDSDATESSSGAESCDELEEGYNNSLPTSASKPIRTRALYKYSAERAWVASRWSWLEAQLSDIECKIHQHNRAYMRLRQMSRSTVLPPVPPPTKFRDTPALVLPPPQSNTVPALHTHSPMGGVSGLVPPSPAHLRPSYTCITRTNTANGSGTTPAATGTVLPPNGFNQTVAGASLSSPSLSSSQHQPYDEESANSCARTAGYRWHRKRRWIRVGNVYERGLSSVYNSGNNIKNNNRSILNGARRGAAGDTIGQPTFMIECDCVPPSTCVLCNRITAKNIAHPAPVNSNTSHHVNNTQQQQHHHHHHTGTHNNLLGSLKSQQPHNSLLPSLPADKTPLEALVSSTASHNNRVPGPPHKGMRCASQQHPGPIVKDGVGLCLSGWHPRVSACSRVALCGTQSKEELLGRSSASFHPVLSHKADTSESYRLQDIIKRKKWLCKLPYMRSGEQPPSEWTADISETHHLTASSNKKKKKSKDKNKERKKQKKNKKALKRKEKEAKKGRLTLKLRKSSVTGELVATASVAGDHQQHSNTTSTTSSSFNASTFYPSLNNRHHMNCSTSTSTATATTPSSAPANDGGRARNSITDAEGGSRRQRGHSQSYSTGGIESSASSATSSRPSSPAFSTSSSCAASVPPPHSYSTRKGSSAANINTSSLNAPAPASPALNTQPLTPAAAAAVAFKNKQGAASYDIDNIVIPYNMASVTRVEHIEYKEIVTPKWRIVEDLIPLNVNDVLEALEEDVSEAMVLARHERSEELEQLRFASHLVGGGGSMRSGRGGRQRGAMSGGGAGGHVSSSAGTNTPDNPLSPHVEPSEVGSPLPVPPPTPFSEDSNISMGSKVEDALSDQAITQPASSTDNTGQHSVATKAKDITINNNNNSYKEGGSNTNSSCKDQHQSVPTSQGASSVPSNKASSSTVISTPFLISLQQQQQQQVRTKSHNKDDGKDVEENTTSEGGTQQASAHAGRKSMRANHMAGRLRSSSVNSSTSNMCHEEESSNTGTNNSGEFKTPYLCRQFPLNEAQYNQMLRENVQHQKTEFSSTMCSSLLHSLDYDDLGESSPSGSEEDGLEEELLEQPHCKRRKKHSESSTSASQEQKKKNKNNGKNSILSSSQSKGGVVENKKRFDDPIHKLSRQRGVESFPEKKNLGINLKDHIQKTVGRGGRCSSEGRSSPLSEVTDSAAEDDLTADEMSECNNRSPDWTISATADSAGHCVMQVLRH